MPSDLTWQQLQNAIAVPNAITYDPQTDDIKISVKALTGDTFNGLFDARVIEFASKLLSACRNAQTQANSNAVAGSRLNAFQAPQFGVPFQQNGEFYALITHTMTAQAPVSFDEIQGTQI